MRGLRTGSWRRAGRASWLLTAVAFVASCAPASPPRTAAPSMASAAGQAPSPRLKVLFLGDGGHHRPAERLRDIATPMLDRGIELYYTEDLADLNLENLKRYDAFLLFANYEGDMPAAQEKALLDYVEGGGGFVPVHSASGNFRTSTAYVKLLGGQFASHDTATFRTRIAEPEHEIMKGFSGLESWDETYVHKAHNPLNRTILEYRETEPYTWTRSQGKGRVFYTAWGHDERTWRNPAFVDLLERGIRWTARQDVQQVLADRKVENSFRYDVLDVPFPPPHSARLAYEATQGPMDRRSNYPLIYQMQQALSPTESMRRMILPAGFRVELFASEPDIVNPIAMTWDERGRLWVVESVEYPYPRELWRDGGGKDRIKILEDTDGDGRADKVTVYAEGLNIPTSITFADGGIIVHQAPQTLFLKDTDGDGRADLRRVLIDGWSQRDTHAGPSHLFYGLDNWVWGTVGYSGFNGTIGGEKQSFLQGVYRFRKDGSKLEFLRRTNNNTWGLGFDEAGGAFISTANGNPSTYLPFPRTNYARLPDLADAVTETLAPSPRMLPLSNEFRQVDWVGAYTAGSGHAVYTARAYPKEYWNRAAFVAEPTGHLVGTFLLEDRGSSFVAPHPRNLVTSDDQWFAPVVAEVGPDGNVWIADWYNFVLQHNAESDRQKPSPGNAYANPLRDRQHGRIYRIVREGASPAPRMTLAGATPVTLVQTLRNDNRLWRIHAQRLLVERGQADVAPELIQLVNDTRTDELGLNVGAIHALWTLHGLGQLDGSNPQALAAARSAVKHPSAAVRRNAIQVLPADAPSTDLVTELLQDADPKVRLQALVRLADLPRSSTAGRAIYRVLAQPATLQDQWLREAASLAATAHSQGFLAAAADAGVLAAALRAPAEPTNLLPNPSFEQLEIGRPAGWTERTASGSAELGVARGEGRNGGNALKITAKAGADASWEGPKVELKPHTRYLIGGWVKVRGVERGSGRGAHLGLTGLPPAQARTNSVVNSSDWTYYERTVTTSAATTSPVGLMLGGGGTSSGEVWVDDVVLRELGPEPGRTLESIVGMVAKQAAVSTPGDVSQAGGVDPRSGAPVAVLTLGVKPDVLQFDRNELRVRAGQQVRVTFSNTDHMEHNLVFIVPGALQRVGEQADRMASSPTGRAQNYVPDTPDVLASTPVLEPGAKFEVNFTAPSTPGRYDFICTIPGHWRVMRGTLVVEPA